MCTQEKLSTRTHVHTRKRLQTFTFHTVPDKWVSGCIFGTNECATHQWEASTATEYWNKGENIFSSEKKNHFHFKTSIMKIGMNFRKKTSKALIKILPEMIVFPQSRWPSSKKATSVFLNTYSGLTTSIQWPLLGKVSALPSLSLRLNSSPKESYSVATHWETLRNMGRFKAWNIKTPSNWICNLKLQKYDTCPGFTPIASDKCNKSKH